MGGIIYFPREFRRFRHSARTPYRYADLLQEQARVAERVRTGGPGAILIAEVAPVITLGRRVCSADALKLPRSEYAEAGIELLDVSRGGSATYHGPGQWIVFTVDSLERLTGDARGVRKVSDGLLEHARAIADVYTDSETRGGTEVGVWRTGSNEKLAALGLSVEGRVVGHGLCFNGYSTRESFYGIDPCGIADAQAGYLLENDTRFTELGELIERQFRTP